MEIRILRLVKYSVDLLVEVPDIRFQFFCYNLILAFGVFATFIDVFDGILEFFESVFDFISVKTIKACFLRVYLSRLISNELFDLIGIPL